MQSPITLRQAMIIAFTAGFTTLALQVFAHRVVSLKLLNNFAFLVISLTMLGFAASGVVLSRWLNPIMRRCNDSFGAMASLLVLSMLLSVFIFYRADTIPQTLSSSRIQFISMLLQILPLSLLFAIPFTFTGMMLGAVLSEESLSTQKVYGADLAGSCLGAILALPIISYLGVENGILVCSGILLVVTFLVLPPTANSVRACYAVAGVALIGCALNSNSIFDMNYPAQSTLAHVKNSNGRLKIDRIKWDPIARIELSDFPEDLLRPSNFMYPSLIGDNADFHRLFQKVLTQNNYAYTFALNYDGKRDSLKGIDRTIYASAYALQTVEKPRALVIGVGGGFDLLTALYHDAASVVGVDVNAATLDILQDLEKDYFKPWVSDPRIKLVLGEGRHFLASSQEKYDIIQLSGVDSYSGSSASAHVFSENFLYTREAFELYFSRLSDNGVMNLMRLEQIPPSEMLKAVVTAVQALRNAGITEPHKHIMTVSATQRNFIALLVKKTPFTQEDCNRMKAWAADNPFLKYSAGPSVDTSQKSVYQVFLELKDPASEQFFLDNYMFDIRPCTDDRPFFFRHTYWKHLLPSDSPIAMPPPVLEITSLVLMGLIGLAAFAFILVPLWFLAGSPRQTGTARFGWIFACTAVGFMAIEIALLQKFGVFLGHPNYALSVVLAALLLGTGIGALYSNAVHRLLGSQRRVSLTLSILVILEMVVIAPQLIHIAGLPFVVRAFIATILAAAPGVLMGTYVPVALTHLKRYAPAYVPWAWGVNGILSVLAPVLSVAVTVTFGTQALALMALPFYLVAGWLYPEDTVKE